MISTSIMEPTILRPRTSVTDNGEFRSVADCNYGAVSEDETEQEESAPDSADPKDVDEEDDEEDTAGPSGDDDEDDLDDEDAEGEGPESRMPALSNADGAITGSDGHPIWR